ncbi:hypothetical protein EUGRSUZ_B00674, partial [Eucalyptus grandis]
MDCCDWEGVDCDEGMGYVIGLDLSESCLSGPINSKASLFRLAHLQSLNLASNDFNYSQIPSAIGDLVELMSLNLSRSNFEGQIPSQVLKLTNLTSLDLSWNVDLELRNPSMEKMVQFLTKLEHLDVTLLNVSAPVPDAVANLSSLTSLILCGCNLQGTFPTTIFELPRLQHLDLRRNPELSGHLPEFHLGSPIKSLSFWRTNISGNIPSSIGNLTQLAILNFGLNKLSGEIPSSLGKLIQLSYLDLGMNLLSGEIPASLTNLTNLTFLDLHYNQLTGQILAEITGLIRFTQLQNGVCWLTVIDVSDNQLHGLLPRGLANCSYLEFLNIENNHIVDTFPSWMGSLSYLNVLILRSNRFHGAVGEHEAHHQFPNLRIVDLSMNNFSEYDCSMTITNKGILMKYERISGHLNVIDLSSNNFTGEIPNSVGSLTELHMLNLSNNALTGSIPLSLANLTELESLDLSSNKLSGMIPPALAQLNFLAFFNVSDNHLSGPIPQVNQFHTFENDSYEGNLGLCGVPLTKKCGDPIEAPLAPPSGAFAEEIDWKIVLMGFGSGLVIGV